MKWLRKLLDKKNKCQNDLIRIRLKWARTKAGMTQTEAASQLGRDQTFLTRIESGSREVTFAELEQLAKIYGKPLSFFETIAEVERRHPGLIVPDNVRKMHPMSFKKKRRKGTQTRTSGRTLRDRARRRRS
jgi:transcriptional regulator with XRE-family HTH domain